MLEFLMMANRLLIDAIICKILMATKRSFVIYTTKNKNPLQVSHLQKVLNFTEVSGGFEPPYTVLQTAA